jgi:NitT/TauT family transport system permease protein
MLEKLMLFWTHGWYTLYETFAGFVLAVVIGLIAAAVIVVVPSVRDVLLPILLIAQLVPKVAIARSCSSGSATVSCQRSSLPFSWHSFRSS